MRIARVKGRGCHGTFSIEGRALVQGWHVKTRPASDLPELKDEAERIGWCRRQGMPTTDSAHLLPLPAISLLITRTVAGKASHGLVERIGPRRVVDALSAAASTLQSAEVEAFPFPPPRWTQRATVLSRIQALDDLTASGKRLHPDFRDHTRAELGAVVLGADRAPKETLVHGDLCMPNVLLTQDGHVSGYLDLGAMHVGEAALDPAILSWSIGANLGDQWADHLLAAQGLSAAHPAVQYHRLSYDLALNRGDAWAWTESPRLVEQREVIASHPDSISLRSSDD